MMDTCAIYRRTLVPVLILIQAFSGRVRADRGSIPYLNAEIDLEEPGQKAIVGWCGGKEVLILATELRASKPTEVLEIMPLPSDPVIEKGSYDAFEAVNRIFQKRREGRWRSLGPPAPASGITITQHKRVGPHDIASVTVREAGEVLRWLREKIRERGGDPRAVNDRIEPAVRSYVERGVCQFLFDFVDLGPATTSVTPVIFIFDSPCIYYPVEITKITGGESYIQLAIISPQHARDVPKHWYPFLNRVWEQKGETVIDGDEAGTISPHIRNLFREHREPIWLSLYAHEGALSKIEDVCHREYIRLASIERLDVGDFKATLEYAGLRSGDRIEIILGRNEYKKGDIREFLEHPAARLVTMPDLPMEERFLLRPQIVRLRIPASLMGMRMGVYAYRDGKSFAHSYSHPHPSDRTIPFGTSPHVTFDVSLLGEGEKPVRAPLRRIERGFAFDVPCDTIFEIAVAWEPPLDGIPSIETFGEGRVLQRGKRAEGPLLDRETGKPKGEWRCEARRFLGSAPCEQDFTLFFAAPGGTWYSERVTAVILPRPASK